MKKIYGFLGAVALMVMASCSNESVFEEDPAGAQTTPDAIGAKGEMYMSMAISPSSVVGTRTATPNQTQGEIGKDRENTISKALVIFAEKDAQDAYKVVTSAYSGTTGTDFDIVGNPQTNYMATFKVDRQTLLTDIKGGTENTSKDYYIFVVANAPAELAGKFTPTADVQQVFATSGDENTYWTVDNFLMSNSKVEALTITTEGIKVGTHTSPTDPFDLGTVKVQRAMSRFDLAVGAKYTKFTATAEGRTDDGLTEGNSDLQDVTIEFDAVALINMAQKAYSFKVTDANLTSLGSKTISFNDETSNNWVFSPEQSAFSTPLFDGAASGGLLTGTTVAEGLESFFKTEAKETSTGTTPDVNVPAAVYRVGGYTKISNIAEADNAYQRPSDAAVDQPDYSIWRYCMENTNPDDINNQKNGNSTGVVFRAQITGNKVDGSAIDGTMGALYAYNSVIIGNAETLRNYVTSPKSEQDKSGVYDAVKLKYADAVAEYNETKQDASDKFTFDTDAESDEVKAGYKKISEATAEDLAVLDAKLVAAKFSIYRPTSNNAEGKYYCYYIYWNRHNDNGNNAVMGPMEFATVRNNVYKLRVSKIHKLGHPGKPEDDPDDPDPDDPDETDSFYCQIICEILPWEVRLNDIEF